MEMWKIRANERPHNENDYEYQNYQGNINGINTNGHEIQQNGQEGFHRDQIRFLQSQNELQRHAQEQRYIHTELGNGYPQFSPQRNHQPDLSRQVNIYPEFSSQSTEPAVSSNFQNFYISPPRMQGGGMQQTSYDTLKTSNTNNFHAVYTSMEMLTDAVDTLIFMPRKLERTSNQLAENFSKVNDSDTLEKLAENLVEQCLSKTKFISIAGSFCYYLAKNVRHNHRLIFCELLVKKLQQAASDHVQMIKSDANKFRQLIMFSTDLYIKFVKDLPKASDIVKDSKAAAMKDLKADLSNILYQLYLAAVTIGVQDSKNVLTVVDMLKLSGKLLEVSGQPMTRLMDNIEMIIQKHSEGSEPCLQLRNSILELVQIRDDGWLVQDCKRPTLFEVSNEASTVSISERPNAIKIVNPLNACDISTLNAGDTSNAVNESESLAEDPKFTEEELTFMNEAIAARDLEKMIKEQVDNENQAERMPEEVEAAFEDFLNEQQAVLPRLQA